MKRILSALLTLCMVISMLPAVNIAEAVEPSGVKVIYPMWQDSYFEEGRRLNPAEIDYTVSGGRISWHEFTGTVTGSAAWGLGSLSIYLRKDEYAAFKIKVPASGYYDIKLDYGSTADKTYATGGAMYFLPGDTSDIATALLTATPVMTVDFAGEVTTAWGDFDKYYKGMANNVPSKTVEDKDLDAGEYIVVWTGYGEIKGGRYFLRPATMTLDGGPGKASMYAESTLSKAKLNLKSATTAYISTSKVVMSDGTSGTAQDISSLTYSSSDESIVTVSENKITAVSEGEAKVYTKSNDRIIAEDKITVENRDVEMSGITVKYPFDKQDYMTLATGKEISYPNSGGRVKYDSFYGTKPVVDNFAWFRNALSLYILEGQYYAFKIQIPKAGGYNVSVGYNTHSSATAGEMYILPTTTSDIAGTLKQETPVATINFKGIDCEQTAAIPFTTENLFFEAETAGEYYLVWKGTGETNKDNRHYLLPRLVTLDGGDGTVPTYTLFKLSKALRPSVEIIMSDGSVVDGNKLGVVYESSDETILRQNPKTGKFETPGTGLVEVTATVEYQGKKYSATVERMITGNEILPFSGKFVKYDFSEKSVFWTPVYWQGEDKPKANDIRGITYEYTSNTGEDGNWEWCDSSIPGIYTDAGKNLAVQTFVAKDVNGHMRVGISKDKWVALRIKVPAAGRYFGTAVYRKNYSGRVAAGIYILPGDVEGTNNIEAALTEDNYIGLFDCNDPEELSASLDSSHYFDVDISDEYINDSGECILVFKALGGGYFDVKSLSLDGTEGMKTVDLSVDSEKIEVGAREKLNVKARLLDESVIDSSEISVKYTSSASNIAEVSDDGFVTGISEGSAEISAKVSYNGTKITAHTTVYVQDTSDIKSTELAVEEVMFVNARKRIRFNAETEKKSILEIPVSEYKLDCDPVGIAYVDDDGYINAMSEGTVTLEVFADYRGNSGLYGKAEITIVDSGSKTEVTAFTQDMRETALENAEKYDWAKKEQKAWRDRADTYVENLDFFYDHIVGEGIPRVQKMGTYNNPDYKYCNYCGEDIVAKYGNDGSYAYTVNFMGRPWKIQCPSCKRQFPSNDFASFYKLGLDAQGLFDLNLARENHHKMLFHTDDSPCEHVAPSEEYSSEWYEYYGYGNTDGYLYNELYTELWKDTSAKTYNTDPNPRKENRYVDGLMWGVDDGFGYIPRDATGKQYTHADGKNEMHTPVALYNGTTWFQDIRAAITRLTNAYLYTGEEKYGRAGAILLDRIADVYPDMDLFKYFKVYWPNTSTGDGAILGTVQDVNFGQNFADAADAFFPRLKDEFVYKYLSAKAETFSLKNKKESAYDIWKNWEENLLQENFRKVKSADLSGNFGMHQVVLIKTALAIGNEADSEEMLDYLYKTGGYQGYMSFSITGGNVSNTIVAETDRDGFAYESSPQYNYFTPDGLLMIANSLALYKGKNAEKYDIIKNPKFAQIVTSMSELVVSDSHTIQLGDSQGMATLDFVDSADDMVLAFKYLKKTPVAEKIAKQIYLLKNGDVSDLHYDIFTQNPESIAEEVEALASNIEKPKSKILTGFGLAMLHDGERYEAISQNGTNNSLRTFWMYSGWGDSGHHQLDSLNIGIEAFGLNLSPDNGYPEAAGSDPNRVQWVETTLAHNSVTVDEDVQNRTLESGDPLHYDGDGRVKLIDMRSEESYPHLDEYRRTLVMIEAPGDISYGVDFFNVQGGTSHIYSFHAQSEQAQTEGLDIVPQIKDGAYSGSYAGVDVPGFKQDPGTPDSSLFYPKGYTWLKNLDRAADPQGDFSIDFAITDYNRAIQDNRDIHLRMTQLAEVGAEFTEVTVADGYVPNKQVNKNIPRGIKYALVKREGQNLKSLFTTVFEPYRGERYVKKITPVEMMPVPEQGKARAVCVELVNGQKDYIVYSTDNTVKYNVGGVFEFRGFVGVYSVDKNNKNVYSYINDGDVIGTSTQLEKEYSGTVADFSRENSYNNYITLNMQADKVSEFAGKIVRIKNDGIQNGAYLIESAEPISDTQVKLNIGLVTTIRKYVDEDDFAKGYVYNIKEGQTAVIAMSHEQDFAPRFAGLETTPSVSAGSTISVQLAAKSDDPDARISYIGTSLPRGASIDSDTGVFTWKPSASQVGDNHVAVTARDNYGRESIIHFIVAVYGSTTNSTPAEPDTPSGGGGGGGGGAAPAPDTDENTDIPSDDETTQPEGDDNTSVGEGVLALPSVGFTDLGNHAWAADAIAELSEKGIIKGTSDTTFSPASNITRADFALLLVRAFGLESENVENFADVNESDYFARELAIARNNGIVGGIGDNKYAPRNTITRQDMMVIVYRAIASLVQREGDRSAVEGLSVLKYEDFDSVAPYAKDAVAALISAGLVNGKNGRIAPTDYTTRAEVAVLIKRILDYTK